MAVLADVVLVADGGDITAGRKTSTLTFGEFNVVLPEDVQQREEQDGRIKDGYVYRPDGVFGPFDVGFARADVTVDLQAHTSDLEAVVDAAQKQSDGDVFFERDITVVGLGGFVPGVDFHVGDIVTVEMWGGLVRLLLPVTDITMISSDSEGVVAWRVHVGGMLISDLAELRRSNEELRRQVKGDRRGIEQARSDASSARSVASSAKSTADEIKQTVEDAEGVIQSALAESVAAEERGRGYAQEAYEHYELAKGSYQSALTALDEVTRLVDESDGILDKNGAIFESVETLHGQVEELHRQMLVASAQFRGLLGSASAHTALSAQYEASAREHVARADEIRAEILPLVEQAHQEIEAGKQHVASALSHAKDARQAHSDAQAQAQLAKDEADRAVQALDDAEVAKSGADAAVQKAGEKLMELQREADEALSAIDLKQNEVLDLHQEVLKKHGEVIDAHDTAIRAVASGVRAAGAAAGSASMGAMYAQLTAEDATRVADSALEVGRLNTEAITLLEEVQEEHSAAMKDLADAQTKLRKATDDLIEAGKVQDQINADLKAAQKVLKDAQDGLTQITKNLQASDRLQNQAIRAVGASAGFAAQTGMHAADTAERATRAADSVLEANRLNTEAILAAEYSIEYNKIMAEAYRPQKFVLSFRISFTDGAVANAGVSTDETGVLTTTGFEFKGREVTIPTVLPENSEIGFLMGELSVWRYDNLAFQEAITATSNYITARRKTAFFGALGKELEGGGDASVKGVIHPMIVLPKYQKRLDALAADFRKRGLPL